MLEKIKNNFNTQTWVLIPIAIAINIAIGQIVLLLKLPVFLDSIGTVLVAVLCGPWAGALTGALSNVIWGIAIDPGAFPWWPVAAMIGYMAGRMAQWGFFKTWWKVVVTGFVVALTAAIVSTPIAVYLFGGIPLICFRQVRAFGRQWSAPASSPNPSIRSPRPCSHLRSFRVCPSARLADIPRLNRRPLKAEQIRISCTSPLAWWSCSFCSRRSCCATSSADK